ncbi:hypothetical protein DFH09DRAFT_1083613 [Mycena vulgaris]|nr:hypothetical protein DFH09DRAFT_1083613 [Mycena vulgaris]
MFGSQMDKCKSGRSRARLSIWDVNSCIKVPEQRRAFRTAWMSPKDRWNGYEIGKMGKLSEAEMKEWSNKVTVCNGSVLKQNCNGGTSRKQKATMYGWRMQEGQNLVVAAGYKALLADDASLVGFVETERAKEASFIRASVFVDDMD